MSRPSFIITSLAFALTATMLRAQTPDYEPDLYIPPRLEAFDWESGETPTLRITESAEWMRHYLLPVIFFDDPGSWELADRYQRFTRRGQTHDYSDTGAIVGAKYIYGKYHEILNIVGDRMRRMPETTIALRGGYSFEPGESAEVARARAEVVRDYLAAVWGIAPSRIAVAEPRRLCRDGAQMMLQQEARCVAIETASWALIAPVEFRSLTYAVEQISLALSLNPYLSPAEIDSLTVTLTIDGTIVGQTTAPWSPDSTLYRFAASWYADNDIVSTVIGPVALDATITLKNGLIRRAQPIAIPSRVVGDIYNEEPDEEEEEETYSTIDLDLGFFPYRDSMLSPLQKRTIDAELARMGNPAALTVNIYGLADAGENIALDDATLDATFRAMAEVAAPASAPTRWSGTLWTDLPVIDSLAAAERASMSEEGYEYAYDESSPYTESTGWGLGADFEVATEDAPWLDTLTRARARAVIAYLKDTLGLDVVNTDSTRSPYSTPILPYGFATYWHYALPEERWYDRGANVVMDLWMEEIVVEEEEFVREEELPVEIEGY